MRVKIETMTEETFHYDDIVQIKEGKTTTTLYGPSSNVIAMFQTGDIKQLTTDATPQPG